MYVEGFIDFGEDVDELGQERMYEQGLCVTCPPGFSQLQETSSLYAGTGYHRLHSFPFVRQPQGGNPPVRHQACHLWTSECWKEQSFQFPRFVYYVAPIFGLTCFLQLKEMLPSYLRFLGRHVTSLVSLLISEDSPSY